MALLREVALPLEMVMGKAGGLLIGTDLPINPAMVILA
jgi:hypothetical protein